MIVYYDPSTNQVMAVYSHETTSIEWWRKGYARAVVPDHLKLAVTRDHKVDVSSGIVTRSSGNVNPEQPQPDANAARISQLRTKLSDDTATLAEIRELLKLERRL